MLRGTTARRPGGPSRAARPAGRALARIVATTTLAVALLAGLLTPAQADELEDEKSRINAAISRSNTDVSASTDRLTRASEALDLANRELEAARVALANAQAAVATAQAEDAKRAEELAAAEAALEEAKAAVAKGEADLAEQQRKVGMNVRETRQQNTTLMSLGVLVTDLDFADLNNRVQWATTIYNVTQAQMDRLLEIQLKLEADKARMTELEASARKLREEAAAQLLNTQALEAAATEAARAMEWQVSLNQQARTNAQNELSASQQENAQLRAESDAITARIVERNAQLERERLEREAREQAAREQAAREAANNQPAPPAPAPQPPAPAAGGGMFVRPAGGWISSPFGSRFHPILQYWAFHEGVDFAAACGTPVYAATSGTVTEAAWVGGYGYYVVVDHGNLGGSYYSTAYGHLQSFIVSRGQWVNRGQIVGYVGTTGLSTGCHLHWNTWQNGSYVNGLNFV